MNLSKGLIYISMVLFAPSVPAQAPKFTISNYELFIGLIAINPG